MYAANGIPVLLLYADDLHGPGLAEEAVERMQRAEGQSARRTAFWPATRRIPCATRDRLRERAEAGQVRLTITQAGLSGQSEGLRVHDEADHWRGNPTSED